MATSLLKNLTPLLFFVVLSMLISCKGNNGSVQKNNTGEANVEELYKGYYKNPQTLDEQQQNMIIDYAVDNNLNLQRLESGLYMMTVQEGFGPTLRWGEKIKVDYRGTYLDGTEFDSSYSRGAPYITAVGTTIAGWNEALIRMKSGGKAKVIVPSRLGYGNKEFAGIPPNSILVFDIHVLI